jgi:hypothetical protein
MKIVFGHQINSNLGVNDLHEKIVVLNQTYVGPGGFLNLLETQMGTKSPTNSDVQRAISYLSALRACDDESKFYHKSLQVDSLGVAKNLLTVRDDLILRGWDFKSIPNIEETHDLAEVETKLVADSHSRSIGERLLDVLKILNQMPKSPIDELQLIDAKETHPLLWQKIIETLEEKGTRVVEFKFTESLCNSDCDLYSAKQVALKGHVQPFSGDGSIRLLQGNDPWEAARWLAAWLAKQDELESFGIILSDRYQRILAAAFLERNIPFGFEGNHQSIARPAAQILVLAIALVWAPKNPRAAIALMLLPRSPIPKIMVSHLIKAIGEAPAIGGTNWKKAVQNLIDRLAKSAKDEDLLFKFKDRVKKWIEDIEVDPSGGLAVEQLRQICTRIAEWARANNQIKEENSLAELAEITDTLIAVARDFTKTENKSLSPETLSRLLAEVLGPGIGANTNGARAGGPRLFSNPSEIIMPLKHIIWWDFCAGTVMSPHDSHWTATHRGHFRSAGISFFEPSAIALTESKRWLRPLLLAEKSFLGVGFETDVLKAPELWHPVLDKFLPSKIKYRTEAMEKILIKIQGSSRQVRDFFKEVGVINLAPKQLDLNGRFEWIAPKAVIGFRKQESPSSIEKILGCPLAYVLSYKLKLYSGGSETRTDFNKLSGIIAHRVFELVFPIGKVPSAENAVKMAETIFMEVVRDNCTEFLCDDQRWTLSQVKAEIFAAIHAYALFLKSNNFEVKAVEETNRAPLFSDFEIQGCTDQVLGINGKAELIIDHKWGGAKYRVDTLSHGTAIQLAIYAHFENAKQNKFPRVGYFITESGRAIILGDGLENAQSVNGEDVALTYQAIIGDLKKSQLEFSKGRVTANGLATNENQSRWPSPCGYCDYSIICGKEWEQE